MAYTKDNIPVGFVRLLVKESETEIVIVIGDRKNWGKRLGTSTIRESLKIAFFELRSKRVIARIHKENKRSIRAFLSSGFMPGHESDSIKSFALTMDDYLSAVNKRAAVQNEIYITKIDKDRLKKLITDELWQSGGITDNTVRDLVRELERANIVGQKQIPRNVVTMNSKALLSLNEDVMEVSLVYPGEADLAKKRLSVLSPIGTAILGYGEGDKIEWEVPCGLAKIHIRKILYQPEAAGDYHL